MTVVIRNGWLLIFITLSFLTKAQRPEEMLTQWAHRSPIEKIYLHFDRDNYIAGETAWFKAYLYSDYLPDTSSTDLYAELVSEKDLILNRKVLPVVASSTHGQFEIPDTLLSGYYLFRAYTPTMLNHDPDFIYQRSIFIYGKKDKRQPVANAEKKTRIEFFPEGGNLVQGLLNTVAFKASDENGLPVFFSGIVRDEKGAEVASISSYHDGMGMFELTPAAGTQYYVVTGGATTEKKFYLPASAEKGIVLSMIPHPQGSFFEIKQHGDDEINRAAYMIGQMQHHVVFRQQFDGKQTELQGVINTQHLHSGILQVTVFNKEGVPLAERLAFVDNKEYVQPVELVTDTLNFSARARNRFILQFRDTMQGNFSIAVTDPEQDLSPAREENIYSRFLLSSDLKGYIHNPAWYFHAISDSVKNSLDLVMMTNGWRRFRWKELSQNNSIVLPFRDPAFITLAGRASLRGAIKKPFPEKQMLVFISAPGTKRFTQLTSTDKNGNFRIDSLVFFGKTRLLFSDIKGKKSEHIDVLLNADSITRSFKLPVADLVSLNNSFRLSGNGLTAAAMDYDAIQREKGIMLENITVKATKKSPFQQVDDNYTTGFFSGDASRAIDLVNSDEALGYGNIFDYMQSRVNGLQIIKDGFDYSVYYRQGASISSMGDIPMIMYLDEVETDASYISAIPASQIALVKLFTSFAAATGNGAGGVLAIYTKKGSDYVNARGYASFSLYQGYSVIREFYAPDYQVKKEETKADNRVTIDWRPDILSNYINPSIPFSFYNNDRSKRFKVVVEGMTSSGKMICLEKIITGK